ncbi:hypothetical protein A1351_11355 [Methylosinus sp. R-45379]|uniref:hypothetical protein n=1 Tax=Methylosinus sp. R-45379 TaxID=980563 RepID=UPI0007C9068F|nr:hypothetical protein [Methylosinus sp. R-45379]OAI28693.1 hypothetical protein A1351_11355 [Methylosinus sp. R-45379]
MAKVLAPPRDPARVALAEAIQDAVTARQNLDDARAAATTAERHSWRASERLDAARAEAGNLGRPEAFIASLASGAAINVLELDRPAADARAKVETAEAELDAWRKARDTAKGLIPDRARTVEYAERRVTAAAAEVVRQSIDVDALLREAEDAQAAVVGKRAALIQLRNILPDGAEREAIQAFLALPWLAHEGNGRWKDHASVQSLSDAIQTLLRDADAELRIS